VGPLTRAAVSDFDTVVIPRFTVLTGSCGGPDDLQRLLTALHTHGSPATQVRAIAAAADAVAAGWSSDQRPEHQPPKGAVPT
jgi:hypothetical protein